MAFSSSVARALRSAGVDVSAESGLLVLDTTAGGPAYEAGLQGGGDWVRVGRYQLPVDGDIIIAIDDQPIVDLQARTGYLETEAAVGDSVQLTILRAGASIKVPVTLGEEPQL